MMKKKHFLWLRMIGYWLKIMKFGTKLKRHQTKFDSMPVYDKNYIKVKVSVFNGVVNRNFFVLTTERWMKYQRKVCMTLA